MLKKKRISQHYIFRTLFLTMLMGLVACQPTSQTATTSTTTSENIPGSGIKVRPASSTSTYAVFMTEVINIGLEKLGYQTEAIKQLSVPIAHNAVGDGELDFYPAHWDKLHETLYQKNGGNQNLGKVGIFTVNALQGYQIDKKTADEYNITSLDQLENPEIAKLFDSDGDGKANLTGCNAGWGCESVVEHQLDSYQLRETVEHDQGQYDTLIADTVARYQQGKPILYYAYMPHWLASNLEVGQDTIWLEVPFTSLPEGQENITEQETSFEGKNLGFAVDDIRVLANKEFVENNPAAKRFFELVSIPIEDISEQQKLVYEGEKDSEDIRRHAEDWVQNNQQQFDSWVEAAAEAVE
ncbi:MAG: glycine betaine/L-proline ABC transporter substrate-binding protein ProX [Microcoleaceae cyanobacterium]